MTGDPPAASSRGGRPATTATRITFAVLCGGCFLAAAAFSLFAIGELYGRVGAEQRAMDRGGEAGVHAAALAVKLEPWRTLFRSDLAWMLGSQGKLQRMRQEYHAALKWNPSSAYLWLDYAQALARAGHLDEEFDLALRNATELAPGARPVRWSSAWIGVGYWNAGGEAARRIWARDMVYVLRVAPADFLRDVLAARREGPFCGYVGAELGLTRWCTAMQAMRQICDRLPKRSRSAAAGNCAGFGLELGHEHDSGPQS